MAAAADIQETEEEFLPLPGYCRKTLPSLKKDTEEEIKFVDFMMKVLPSAENFCCLS